MTMPKIPSNSERLTRFVMIGPSSLNQSLKRKVGIIARVTSFYIIDLL